MIWTDLSFFILTIQSFQEETGLKGCGKDLNNSRVSVSLISSGCLTKSTERSKCCLLASDLLKDLCTICKLLSFSGNNKTLRSIMVDTCVVFDLAILDNRCCTVQCKRERLICRHTKCQWVGSKHILNTKCRCNGWSCVGTADTDHILFCCETCPISCDSIMGRVTDCNHTHAVFMCFFNTHVHSLLAGYHSHTIVGIENCSCWCLFKDIDLCYWI